MRLWSIHPRYLDPRGLVALWREALLAQKVLQGETSGYRQHPQLIRFREHPRPLTAITVYLWAVHQEAERRTFRFDSTKIDLPQIKTPQILLTRGQLLFEIQHLQEKLKIRHLPTYQRLQKIQHPAAHPLFKLCPGDVAVWERGGMTADARRLNLS